MNERELTAHHEAGHAVSYVQLGYVFDHVTLEPTESALGEVVTCGIEVDFIHNMMNCLAGPAAEAVAMGMTDEEAVESMEAVYYGAALGETDGDFSALTDDALPLFPYSVMVARSNWDTISRVADHLLTKPVTPYKEVADLVAWHK